MNFPQSKHHGCGLAFSSQAEDVLISEIRKKKRSERIKKHANFVLIKEAFESKSFLFILS